MTGANHPKGLPPGTVIGGRFRLRSLLGEGGTAHVFLADDLAMGGEVAVKVVKRRLSSDAAAAERLDREGRLLHSLEHPGIVRVETWGEEPDGTLFLAMELLTGESLRSRIQRQALRPAEITPILCDATAALSVAHAAGVVHRDLKPDNLFLVADHSEVCVKLLDFGVSKAINTEKLTRTGQILGTPRYMAPEQLAGDSTLDHRVDIYSMGVILYESLSGQTPFGGTTPSELIVAILRGHVIPLSSVCPNAVPEIEALIERAIAKEPANRFESMSELYNAWIKLAPAAGESKRQTPLYRTAAMGKLLNPLPDGAPAGEERPSHSGTFSGLAAVKKSEASADTLMSFDAPVREASAAEAAGAQPPIAIASAAIASAAAQPPVAVALVPQSAPIPPTAQPALAREPGPRAALPAAQAAGSAPSRYHPRRERGFWSTLKRRHFVGMMVSAIFGAFVGGAWVVWTVTNSGATSGVAPQVAPPSVQTPDGGGPDIILREAPHIEDVGPEATADEVPIVAPDVPPRPAPARSRQPRGVADEGLSLGGAGNAGRRNEASEAGTGAGGAQVDAPARSARETARAARSALRQGRLDECVRLSGQAYRAGVPTALLTRGDCLRAQSSTASALKDYQRFCRLYPEHRAARAARERARRLGGTCP